MMTAKLYASRSFRRRSYDDQEGDNDINIILQPNEIDDLEQETRAKYANYLASKASNFGRFNYSTSYDDQSEDPNQQQQQPLDERINATELASATDAATTTTITTIKSRALKIPKLTTMTNIFEDVKLARCLLDQNYNQTVRLFIEKSALNWNFNSFTFDALCCGRSLTELLLHLFDHYNLYKIFNLDIVKVLKCFRLLEFGYHSTNPYHNSVHAADVTQAMHCFIQEKKIRKHMTNLEILCSILAAVCHDLDHPGVNQSFLVATNNPLAGLYQNSSVLENHHWRFALCIFKESKLFDHFSEDVLEDMKEQLKHLILATDIARQNEYLKRFKDLTSSHKFSMQNTDDRSLVLQMALKCADLGNPCRPWLISRVWSNLICDEFYRMGQIEKRLGVPLTPICQREKTCIAGIQADFFRFIVLPLLELWHRFLESPLSDLLMSNFDHNYKRWQRANRIVQQLRRRKSVACLEPIRDDPIEEGGESPTNQSNVDGETASMAQQSTTTNDVSNYQATKLLFDPAMESYYANHPFGAIKRASSDYIKSGNGKLELLREYKLDRLIEKSPLINSKFYYGSKKKRGYLAKKASITRNSDTTKARQSSSSSSPPPPPAPSLPPSTSDSTTNQSHESQTNPMIGTKENHQLPPTTEHSPNRKVTSTGSGGCSPSSSSLGQGCCQKTTATTTTTTTTTPISRSAIKSQPPPPTNQREFPGIRKALSPIQDGEGPSPDIQEDCTSSDKASSQARGRSSANKSANLLSGDQRGHQHRTDALVTPSKASPSHTFSSSASSSSSTSPSLSRSLSRASSACSSPVTKRSISSKTSIDRALNRHIKQSNQPMRSSQNQPHLAQYYEPSSCNKIKPSNLTSTRKSSSNPKNVYRGNNKRRESDPGCLTDNYELAAAIVLLQYRSNSLFHKRRSSLPICLPKRRSSK